MTGEGLLAQAVKDSDVSRSRVATLGQAAQCGIGDTTGKIHAQAAGKGNHRRSSTASIYDVEQGSFGASSRFRMVIRFQQSGRV